MLISQKITWWKFLDNLTNPLDTFPSKESKRTIKKSLSLLANSHYQFKIEDLDMERLNSFTTLYNSNISKKADAHLFPVKEQLTANMQIRPYKIISLYHKNTMIGGKIFSLRETHLHGAFKYLPYQLEIKLPASLGLIADYYYCQFALQNKFRKINLGADPNAYGLLGFLPSLAVFKASCGYIPYTSLYNFNLIDVALPLDNPDDILILQGTEFNQPITAAILGLYRTSPSDLAAKYGALSKAGLKLEIIDRSNQPKF